MAWISPAGGLRYHWRAARYSKKQWRPFREALSLWLTEWAPPEHELILVGPSAGYCLDAKFLARFTRLTALEPDPLARLLLQTRMRHLELRFHHEDFFTCSQASDGIARFARFLAERPQAAVLFCNFLGQFRLLLESPREEEVLDAWKRKLRQLLSGRSWASVHDRVSGSLTPRLMTQPLALPFRLSDDALIQRFYSPAAAPGGGELFDHLTSGFFCETDPHTYFVWQLGPKAWHLIEGVHSRKIPKEAN